MNHVHAAEKIHRAVKAAIFRNDVKEKVRKMHNQVTSFVYEARQFGDVYISHSETVDFLPANISDVVENFEVDDLLQIENEIMSSIVANENL